MTSKKKIDLDTELLELAEASVPTPQRVAASQLGMVATAHFRATQVGVEILEGGGNAVDAAVGAAFALGVCEPQACGLGGQTMMLLHMAESGKTIALDGSSRAPSRAVIDPYLNKSASRFSGYTAATVPSTLATLDYTLNRYGTFELGRVLEPVIHLAREGYQITELQHKLLRREISALKKGNSADLFLKDGKKSYRIGSVFRQSVLGDTLCRLADKGMEEFYTGDIAGCIHEDMQKNGGFIQKDDLAMIPLPIEREPVSCRFGNMHVFTMPPPGSGRTLIEILNILRKFPAKNRNPDTTEGALLLAEIMRRAQLDRRDRPFEPNFYPQVDERRMLSNDYAKLVAEKVRSRMKGSGETTHLTVMDRHGNVVSLTQSIERVYGAKVATRELGFLYNNYMCAFEYEDVSNPYYLRPNAVPWASVAPTIVFRAKKPWLAIGSPGSERIVSTLAQVLVRLNYQSPFDAVAAPRMHCSYNGKVSLEAACMRNDIPEVLARKGFKIDIREPMSFYLGCVQMVLHQNGEFIGVADPRRDGSAGGPRS
ncbi:MAG: gamma-glutamyltransferase [Planctomycetota bacterium]|jgi:gamma-glutamyltranspeptidase/glutathione hydrolase